MCAFFFRNTFGGDRQTEDEHYHCLLIKLAFQTLEVRSCANLCRYGNLILNFPFKILMGNTFSKTTDQVTKAYQSLYLELSSKQRPNYSKTIKNGYDMILLQKITQLREKTASFEKSNFQRILAKQVSFNYIWLTELHDCESSEYHVSGDGIYRDVQWHIPKEVPGAGGENDHAGLLVPAGAQREAAGQCAEGPAVAVHTQQFTLHRGGSLQHAPAALQPRRKPAPQLALLQLRQAGYWTGHIHARLRPAAPLQECQGGRAVLLGGERACALADGQVLPGEEREGEPEGEGDVME